MRTQESTAEVSGSGSRLASRNLRRLPNLLIRQAQACVATLLVLIPHAQYGQQAISMGSPENPVALPATVANRAVLAEDPSKLSTSFWTDRSESDLQPDSRSQENRRLPTMLTTPQSLALRSGTSPHRSALFVPNKGQAVPSSLWQFAGNDYQAHFFKDGFSLRVFLPGLGRPAIPTANGPVPASPHSAFQGSKEQRITFIGSNPAVSIEALDEQRSRFNYFYGQNSAHWVTGVESYARLRYKNVYPGIDVTFYSNEGKLEYDFTASAGADPSLIKLKVDGDDGFKIASKGELQIGDVVNGTLHRPLMYQNVANGKRLIEGRFVALAHDVVKFDFGKYDKSKPFIVDPTISLLYSTYIGGKGDDEASGIALDTAGDTYVYGFSFSEDFPVSANAYQSARSQNEIYNLVLSKFDASGNLLFSTYLHGTGGDYACFAPPDSGYIQNDQPCGIALDAVGNAYITGNTQSHDFPVTSNAYQGTFQGNGNDAFIAEISSDGSSLLYSTFIGGANGSVGADLALDASQHHIYLLGYAGPGYPTTTGAYLPTLSAVIGNQGIVVSEIDPTLTGSAQLVASTYFGSSNPQANAFMGMAPSRLKLSSSGNVWAVASAYTNNLPTTANALEPTIPPLSTGCYGGGSELNSAGFVFEMSSDLSKLTYASYLSGNTTPSNSNFCSEIIFGLALDSSDNVYLSGTTASAGFPVTANAIQGTYSANGNYSGVVAKLSADGSKLLYSSYIGGEAGETYSTAIALDSNQNIWLAGSTAGGASFPLTSNAFQPQNAGGQDGFITELSNDGASLLYSTYIGGSGNDAILGIALDAQGNVHVDGYTNSSNFPLTPDALQSVIANGEEINGWNDEFFAILGGGVIGTFGPTGGGNTGDTTITVNGAGLQQGATCSIVQGSTTIAATQAVVSTNGTSITCTFALSGAALGSYSVVVTNPGGASLRSETPFTVEAGTGPLPWTNVTGRPLIRFNSPSVVTVTYGNSGDTDAIAVPLYINLPAGVTFTVNSTLLTFTPPANDDSSTFPISSTIDDGSTMIPILIPRIQPGQSGAIQLSVTLPSSVPTLSVTSSIFPPFFANSADLASSLVVAGKSATLSHGQFGVKPDGTSAQGFTCLSNIAAQIYSLTPVAQVAQCGKSGTDFLINAIDAFSAKPGISTTATGWSLGKLTYSFGQAFIDCSTAALSETPFGLALSAAARMASYISDFHDLGETISSCREALSPSESTSASESGVGSIDPNAKSGPAGDGSIAAYVSGTHPLSYNIAYENEPTATAPASQVVITDQLDPTKVNLNTATLGPISFGSTIISPPSGVSNFSTVYNINTSLSVRIQGGLNPDSGLMKWTLTSIDPSTGLPPTDPTVGFLPPNTDGVQGQGSVIFTALPAVGQSTGAQITNTATVVFDSNAPISTPTWLNTLDVNPPTSAASAPTTVAATNGTANIPVTWTGMDKGSGIANYSIYVSDNGGAYSAWQWQIPATTTSAAYSGQGGHTYGFYSIATDGAGNVEAAKNSADATSQVTEPQVATPTFSPVSGTYTSSQTVTISDATSGDTIYYTTNGTTPTTSSNVYSAPITVSSTETIEAVAVAAGDANSAVATATYTISAPTAATPTFSPASGTYTSAQTVTINDATTGAMTYYTTNGTTPTTSSTKYSGPITVSSTETIEAIAVASGDANSAVASATYTINLPPPTVATPTFTPAAGTYTSSQTVTIGDATSGATIYYTTNGTTPTTGSTKYAGPITVSSTETIEAIAVVSDDTNSAVATATYTINGSATPTATPTFSPAGGTYTAVQKVTLSDTTHSVTFFYTTDGTVPTTSSTVYNGPITVSSTETISAIAALVGVPSGTYTNSSAVGSATYTINIPAPSFSVAVSPASLTVTGGQSGTVAVSVTPQNAFSAAVSFSCSGLPAGATCSFSPGSVTPSGTAAATTTLTVSASSNSAYVRRSPGSLAPGMGLAIALCFIGWRRRNRLQLMLLIATFVAGASTILGCGGSSSSVPPQPQPTTSTVTITGTSGALQQTTTFSLTVN